MNLEWTTPVQYVKRVGPRRAEALAKEGVRTVGELLLHAPFRYEDRTNFRPIASLQEGEIACISGKIIASAARSTSRLRMKIFEMVVRDATGAVSAVFFNQPYLKDTFQDGMQVILYGRPNATSTAGCRATSSATPTSSWSTTTPTAPSTPAGSCPSTASSAR